jgi:hypothetical protein
MTGKDYHSIQFSVFLTLPDFVGGHWKCQKESAKHAKLSETREISELFRVFRALFWLFSTRLLTKTGGVGSFQFSVHYYD